MLLTKSLKISLAALLLVVSTAALPACSSAPKPPELVELERILQDPEARKVKEAPGASKYYREARQYRRVALEAYNEGEIDRAKEYSVLGKLRYRTAAAIQEQHKAKGRLDEANAKVAEVNPKIQTLSQERNKLQAKIGELQRQVARARNEKAQRERREAALRDSQMQRPTDNSEAKKLAAKNKIEEAKKAREDALEVKANEYAKGAYNRANNQLKSALTMFEGNAASADTIVDTANGATMAFRAAAKKALPKYQEAQEKMKPGARRTALRQKAENTFGGPFTVVEPNGVRVVLAMLFEEDATVIRPSSRALVKSAAELAKKYEEATITVEGYTRKGDATQNLATSQVRAKTVRDFLVNEGVASDRVSTNGMGQEQRRYPDDPAKNDRVEVIFSIAD